MGSLLSALPHARKVLGYILEDTDATLDRSRIADSIVWFLLLLEEYVEAEKIRWTAVVGREEVLEVKHPDTLASISHLGFVLAMQDKYEEAKRYIGKLWKEGSTYTRSLALGRQTRLHPLFSPPPPTPSLSIP